MKIDHIKQVISFIMLGASLVIYAQSTFTTKETANEIKSDVSILRTESAQKGDIAVIREDLKEIRSLVIQLVKEKK